MQPPYVKPAEVASTLRVSVSSIYGWIHKKKLRAVRIGNTLRIPQAELDRLLGNEEAKK